VVIHSILEPTNLFNFEKLKTSPSSNFFFSTSTNLLCNPETYQILSARDYNDNAFTRSLQILKIDFGRQGGVVEGRSFSMLHGDGLWTLVDEESSKAPHPPIANNDTFKFGNQVVRFQYYNPSDVSTMNANFLSLYKHIFGEYDFSEVGNFNFVKKFGEVKAAVTGENSVRGSAVSMGQNTPVCRICLDFEKPTSLFCYDICKCSESMPVHGDCLLDWIKMKCKPNKTKHYQYYDLAHTLCDVCKEQYPPFLIIKDEKHPLIRIEIPKSGSFALMEIYKIEGNNIKHLVVVDLSKKGEERYTIGSSAQAGIQFKSEVIKDYHANLVSKGDKLFMFNLDRKYGTLRKVQAAVPLETLHMKVLISGKFSFLFHVFSKGTCNCIKKGLKTIKSDPLDTDPRLTDQEFGDIKKELRSFAKKGPVRQEVQTVNELPANPTPHQPPASAVGRSGSTQKRRDRGSSSDNYASEAIKKKNGEMQRFEILRQNKQQFETHQPLTPPLPLGRISEKEFEDIQARKLKRMTIAKQRVDNDFSPTIMDGPALPRPTIGTSELFYNSAAHFHFN
jgi:hypothetical protein